MDESVAAFITLKPERTCTMSAPACRNVILTYTREYKIERQLFCHKAVYIYDQAY